MGSLITARSNPPIRPRLIKNALWWKGKRWKINVVGIRKSNRKADPIFWFLPKMKKTDPKVRQMIAPTNNIDETGWTKPLEEIYSTVFWKPIILRGISVKNIEDIANLAKKSKNFFIVI